MAEKMLALHKDDLIVLRDSIRSVAITQDPWIWIRGVRAPGTGLPLTLAVGTWKFHGGQDFLLIKGKQRSAVVFDLEPDASADGAPDYARIIVSTLHAARLVEALRFSGDADADEPDGELIE